VVVITHASTPERMPQASSNSKLLDAAAAPPGQEGSQARSVTQYEDAESPEPESKSQTKQDSKPESSLKSTPNNQTEAKPDIKEELKPEIKSATRDDVQTTPVGSQVPGHTEAKDDSGAQASRASSSPLPPSTSTSTNGTDTESKSSPAPPSSPKHGATQQDTDQAEKTTAAQTKSVAAPAMSTAIQSGNEIVTSDTNDTDELTINTSGMAVSTLAELGLITSAEAARLEKSALPLPPSYLQPPSPSEPSLMSLTTATLESGFPISGKLPKVRKFKTRPSFFDSPPTNHSPSDNLIGRSFAHLTYMPEVDIVYTWVNGSDPKFQSSMDYWKRREDQAWRSGPWAQLKRALNLESVELFNAKGSAAGKHRYRDNNELRYSLRSVWRYAPWVRKVHILTNGQVPRWLNISHPRVNIVTHEEIYPDPNMVPVFASPSIEVFLHRIPGLADKYIYLCDDFMFGNVVWPDDFWSPRVGHRVYLAWAAPECQPGCKSAWLGDGICDEVCRHPLCNYDMGDCGTAEAPLPANPRGKGKFKSKRELLPLPQALELGGYYRPMNPLRTTISKGSRSVFDPPVGTTPADKQGATTDNQKSPTTSASAGSKPAKLPEKSRPDLSAASKRSDPTAINMKDINELKLDEPDSSLAIVCASGCPVKWLGDGVCDSACNVESCAFDSGDCGTELLSNLYQVKARAEQMDGYALLSSYQFPTTHPTSNIALADRIGEGLMLGAWTPPHPSEIGLPVTNIIELPGNTKSFVIDVSQLFAKPTPNSPHSQALRVQIVPSNLVQSATVHTTDRLITLVLSDDDASLPLLKHPIASRFDPEFLALIPKAEELAAEGNEQSSRREGNASLPLGELPDDLKVLVEKKQITPTEATAIVGTLLERQQALTKDAQLVRLGQHTSFEIIIEGKLSPDGIRSGRVQRQAVATEDRQQRQLDKQQNPPPEKSFAVRSKGRPRMPAIHGIHRVRLVFYRRPQNERQPSASISKPDYEELVKKALTNTQSRAQLKMIHLDSKDTLAWLGKVESAATVRALPRQFTPAEEQLIKEKKVALLEKFANQNTPKPLPTASSTTPTAPASFLEVDTQVQTSTLHLIQTLPEEDVLLSPSTALSLALKHPTWLIDFDPKSCDRPLDAAVEREALSSLYEGETPAERRLREIFRETVEVFGLFGTMCDCSSTMESIMQLLSKSSNTLDKESYQSQALSDWKLLHTYLGRYMIVSNAPSFVRKCQSLSPALIRDVLSGVYDNSSDSSDQDYEPPNHPADDYIVRGVVFEGVLESVLREYGVNISAAADTFEDRFIRPDSRDGDIWEQARSQGALGAIAAVKRRDLIDQRIMLAQALQRQLLREKHAEKRTKERSKSPTSIVVPVTYPWELDLKNLTYPLSTPDSDGHSASTPERLPLNFDPLDPLTLRSFSPDVSPFQSSVPQPSNYNAGRKLLDMYGSAVRYTSALFNARFGYTDRKVYAHAPLLMDRHVVQEIVSTWPEQFEATARHRFRHPLDMQYELAYAYYLLSEPAPLDVPAFFQQMDLDGDGYLDIDEVNYLAYALNKNARPKPNARDELARALHESQMAVESRSQSKAQNAVAPDRSGMNSKPVENAKLARVLGRSSTPPPAQVRISLDAFVRTPLVVESLKVLNSGKKKYRATIEPNPDVCFIKISEDLAAATRSLDNCRSKMPRFICLNDDVTTEGEKSARVREVMRQFYESYFPKPSPFELTEGENPYLHIQPLREHLKRQTHKSSP